MRRAWQMPGKKMPDITHATLVKAGRLWLLNQRYRIVAIELATSIGETPDVIGWKNQESCVIECKTSRADFFADQKKLHRRSGMGVGERRWYLTPAHMLLPMGEIPEGWGLLEYHKSQHTKGYYIKQEIQAETDPSHGNLVRERAMLVSIAWRALEALKLVKPLSIGGDDNGQI